MTDRCIWRVSKRKKASRLLIPPCVCSKVLTGAIRLELSALAAQPEFHRVPVQSREALDFFVGRS